MRRITIPADIDLDDPHIVEAIAAKFAAFGVMVELDRDQRQAVFAAGGDSGGGVVTMTLAPTTKAAQAAELAALIEQRYPGWVLTRFDAAAHIAERRQLSDIDLAVRASVARVLLCSPWEVEVDVEVVDGELDEVLVTRLPPGKPEQLDKAAVHLAQQVLGHSGWRGKVNHADGTIRCWRGARIDIPLRAPIDFAAYSSRGWSWLPFATDGRGNPLAVDLADTPHGLVVGKTGSGKTILLVSLAAGALTAGCELAVVDPTKAGLDFLPLKPWVRPGGWGCASFDDAAAVLRTVYDEAMRRKALLQEMERPKWTALTPDQLAVHNIRPIVVIVDEGTSLAKEVPIPKSLPKDDPEREEAEALNLAKARIMALLGKIARECRFVGVHMVLGTQRFDVANFGAGAGELRENLGARIILGRASRTALGMACSDGEAAVEAHQLAHGVDVSDSDATEAVRRPGRGIAEIDGLGTVPFQGWWADDDQVVAHLDRMVPRRPDHLSLTPATPGSPPKGGGGSGRFDDLF